MSLVVWLPLNGTLENKGISNAKVTNNNATIDNAGKIGSCYSFNGTSAYLQTSNFNPSKWPEFSITFWCYPTATFNNLFLIRGSNAHRFRIASDGVSFRDTNNSTLRTIGLNATIPIDTWTHLTCIYNRGKISIYINGLITVNNTSYYRNNSTFLSDLKEIRIARYTTTSTSKYYSGKLNDIRIYNHALSPAEVKEIAQGLVLHYKLDNITNGIVQDSSGYNHNGTINRTLTLSSNTTRYSICGYFGAYNTPNIIINDTSSFAPALSNCTVTWWGKYNTTKTLLFAGQTTSHYIAASNNNTYYHGTVGSNTKTFYKDGVAGSYKCAADGWHFFAITGLDLSTWTTLKLNGYSSTWPLKGYINDLRIYSTILSPDDILALYHTGAKIDNLQNTHTFEYIEDQSLIKVTKQGQIKCDEIIEDTNVKIKKDNTIEAFKFIEL